MKYMRNNGTVEAGSTKHTFRRGLALVCVALGIAGCILPIIPGLPLFVVAARLLGPEDALVMRTNEFGHSSLRRMRGSRVSILRRAGTTLTPHWNTLSRLMTGGA